jgi:putative transposase
VAKADVPILDLTPWAPLVDAAAGHRKYVQYLDWLAEDEPEQKRQRFARMSHGWALGTADFARSLMQENETLRAGGNRLIADMRCEYEEHWSAELAVLLRLLRRSPADLAAGGKSAEWKVAVAAALKSRTTVTNQWLSQNLHLGNRHEIGRKVAKWRRTGSPALARKLRIPTPHNPAP